MKVIKPIIFGLLGGLALSLVLVVGLYLSPLREPIYYAADPEIHDVRSKLSKYREWLSQADFYIEEKGPSKTDSLQNAQGLAWGEYKKWRTHFSQLAHIHIKPTAEGFWAWIYSLRYFAIPFVLLITFAPVGLFAGVVFFRMRSRSRLVLESKSVAQVHQQALTSFEDAIKKVAQLTNNTTPVNPMAEQRKPVLPMEDEEIPPDESLRGVMPPTTEIERVERRKEEVLKLARKGVTSSEISRRLRLSQDQVEFIIRLRREKG